MPRAPASRQLGKNMLRHLERGVVPVQTLARALDLVGAERLAVG